MSERISAVVLSVLLVVSAATAAVPASAFAPDGGSAAVGTDAGNASGNDGTTTLTETATTTTTTTATAKTTTTTGNDETTASTETTTTTTTTATTTTEETTKTGGPDGKPNPKVSSSLAEEVGSAESGPASDGTRDTEFVQVVVRATPGRSDEVAGLVGTNGGDVQVRHEDLVQARVPTPAVQALADSPAVEFVRKPRKPDTTEITGEGLSNMDVGTVHDAGVTGENVTVAVVDLGFDVTNPEIADQLVNWRNFSSPDSPRTMSNESGRHGTATAELVADTAPNASIIAVKVDSATELYEAIDWLESNTSTDVVTMSLSWYNVGPLDGTAKMNREINSSIRNGTTWFTSAGNDGAASHWNGTWSDPDGDDWLNFDGSDERMNVTPSGGSGTVYVAASWNDWGGSTENYDFYLVDENDSVVDYSNTTQDGTQPPTEYIYEYVTEPVYLKIENRDANGTSSFDLFFRGRSDPEYWTSGRSITVPGTGRNIVTVGAVYHGDNRLEPFSSRGPTIDGRTKPDVVAPDGVTTSESDRFYGTSAATPYTAGVAALMLDADESLSPAEVKSRLRSSAVPLRGTEPNNETGYGLVDADGAVSSVDETHPDRVTYTGRIVAPDGGTPVGDAVVAKVSLHKQYENLTSDTGNFSVTAHGVNDTYALGYYQGDPDRKGSEFMARDGVPDLRAFEVVNGTTSADLGNVTLPEAHVLNVTVVNESGDPVPNAEVEVANFVHDYENNTHGYVTYATETGSNGTLTVGGTTGIEVVGDVRVMAAPPDGSSGYAGPNYTDIIGVQNDTNVTVTLETEGATVSGQVDDADGEPSADDGVLVTSDATGDFAFGTTNATGNFSMSGVEEGGPYVVGYYQNWSADTRFPQDGTADIYVLDKVNVTDDVDTGHHDVPNASLLNVRVVDESGDPVPNATVSVDHHRLGMYTGLSDLSMDSQGYVAPGGTRGVEMTGNVGIRVRPPDSDAFVDETYIRNVTVSSDIDVTVTLQETINVSGQVYEADGDPSADDAIEAANWSTTERAYDVTGSSGDFTLTDLHAGRPYHVSYYQDFGISVPPPRDGTPDVFALSRVNATEDVDLGRFDLPNASVLNVTVTDGSGTPVEGARVDVWHHRSNVTAGLRGARTGTDGYLAFSEHPGVEVTGDVSVTVYPPENGEQFLNETYTRNLTVTTDRTVSVALEDRLNVHVDGQNVDVVVNSTEQLTGLTVELGGDASGTLTRSDFTETVQSDGDYSYRANVSDGTDGTFEVTLAGTTDADGDSATYNLTEPVTVDTHGPDISEFRFVTSGQDVDLKLTANEPLSEIQVNLTGDAGGSLARDDFTETKSSGGYTYTADVSDGRDGTFEAEVTHLADDYGNAAENFLAVATEEVDTTAPEISNFSVTEPTDGTVRVSFDANESLDAISVAVSGPESATLTRSNFTENGGTYTATYAVDSDGEYTATLETAADSAGHDGASGQSDSVVVDTTAPNVTVESVRSENNDVNVSDGERVSVAVTVTDGLSRVESVAADAAALGGGTVALTDDDGDGVYRGSFTVDAAGISDGKYVLYVSATDSDGNGNRYFTQEFLLDTRAPNTTDTLSGETGSAGWYTSAVEVTLSPSDGTSSVARTEYRVDGGDWATYDGSFTVEADGAHTVEYRSVDEAGNEEATQSVEFSVDTTAPTTDLATNATANDNGWYDSDVNVTLSATDGPSGVRATYYRTDGGPWKQYTPGENVSFTTDGNHTVEFSSVDEAGNEETNRTETVRIDTQKPTVTDPPGLNRTDEILPEHAVRVVVNATDDNRVDEILVDGVPVGADGDGNGRGPVPAASALGNHTFEVVVRDVAGNEYAVSNETLAYTVGEQVEMNETENGTLAAETNDTNVGEVAIETANETSNASVTVGTATKNPEETRPNESDPKETPLYFPQINVTVSNDAIENATVTVTVEQSRVEQKYVKPGTVKFWVEEENKSSGWEKVDAQRVDTDDADGTYTYEIAAPHFSTYAITGETESTPPTVTAFDTVNETPTTGGVTLSAEYDDGYAGVSAENVTLLLAGSDVTGEATVTDSGLTFVQNLSAGTYTAELFVQDDAGNSLPEPETVTFTVENRSSGGNGGSGNEGGDTGGSTGGSSGGGGVPEPSVHVSIEQLTADSLRSKVTSARSGSPGEITPSAAIAAGDVSVRSLTVRPESSDALPRFFVDASVTESVPDGASPPDVTALGYLRVDTTYLSSSLSEVGVRFAVPADAAAAPENVALYRFDGGTWRAVETGVVAERGGSYVLRATASETGTFAVGVRSGSGSGTTTGDGTAEPGDETTDSGGESDERALNDATATTDDGRSDGTTSDDGGSGAIPGFGVPTALVALLAALLVARRRLA